MKNSAFAKIIMVTGVLGLTACGGNDRDETGSVPPEAVADAMVQKSVEELTLLDVNNLALNAASIQILTDEEWQKVQAGSLKIATNTIIADDSEQFFPPIKVILPMLKASLNCLNWLQAHIMFWSLKMDSLQFRHS